MVRNEYMRGGAQVEEFEDEVRGKAELVWKDQRIPEMELTGRRKGGAQRRMPRIGRERARIYCCVIPMRKQPEEDKSSFIKTLL